MKQVFITSGPDCALVQSGLGLRCHKDVNGCERITGTLSNFMTHLLQIKL